MFDFLFNKNDTNEISNNSSTNKIIKVYQIFSDCIFIWVFIYLIASKNTNTKIGNFLYNNTNPIFLLYIALIDNLYILLFLILNYSSIWIIIKYIIIIIIIKLIPLYLIDNTKINIINNFLFSFFFFIIFSFYLYIFYNTNFFEIHQRITDSIMKDDNITPFNYFIRKYLTF